MSGTIRNDSRSAIIGAKRGQFGVLAVFRYKVKAPVLFGFTGAQIVICFSLQHKYNDVVNGMFQDFQDYMLIEEMKEVRRLAAAGLALRQKAKIKVRQPLQSFCLKSNVLFFSENRKELCGVLLDELNVKEIFCFPKNVL